jgi:mannitol/fructose-specific phosphotransferase system IIA component (Ntr-type)
MAAMSLKQILGREAVAVGMTGRTKEEIIGNLLDILVKAGKIQDRKAALDAVLERERKMSTGMKHGIAIPHGKTPIVKELVACIGISQSPVDFDSLDREPSRIFIMTLSPPDKTGPHLQFLAEISLLFKSADKRAGLLEAKSPEEVLSILTE